MSLTQSVWCSMEAIYGSCCNCFQKIKKKKGKTLQQDRSENSAIVSITTIYFVLVDTPYPDDWVSPSSEEPIESRVQLQCIHPISIVFFHLISNDIRHLKQKETSASDCYHNHLCHNPSNTPTYVCIFRSVYARNSKVPRSCTEIPRTVSIMNVAKMHYEQGMWRLLSW